MISLLILCTAAILPELASAASIPQSLQSSIPQCARSCLSSYIQGNFPASVCTDKSDVDCLCSHTGVQGFTLQEGAFVCAHQHCAGQADQDAIDSTYGVCNGRPGALGATHTILPTAFSARPTQHTSTTSSSSSSTTTSARATSSVQTITPTASPSATPQRGLQTSQIIGISVACAAAAIAAVSIAVLLFCMRRRRRGHEQLDSGKLSYEEFKPPSIAEKRTAPEIIGMKDPRGGAGGVGVAPVRYKAILPPANLFAQPYIPPVQTVEGNEPSPERPPEPRQTMAPPSEQARPAREAQTLTRTHPNTNNAILSGFTSMASSCYSTDAQPAPPTKSQAPVSGVARPPSALLPGRRNLNAGTWANNGRESSASQFTQFEEDGPLQSATIPAAIANRPLYPHTESSESTASNSQDASCTSSSSTPPVRSSRGPSLRISIPGKQRSNFNFPPPPPMNQDQVKNTNRPTIATTAAASMPFVPMGRAETLSSAQQPQQARHEQPRGPVVTQTSVSPPPQFPGPPTGRLVAQGLGAAPRKDSVSRRGFSQPNAPLYMSSNAYTRPGPQQVRPSNHTQLTVNGERINYPNIPRPAMSPEQSARESSPPTLAMPLPPPPPGPPPRFVGPHTTHSYSSSDDTTASNIATAGSLLAKRRGSQRAAALESQLRIHHSNGSTSHLPAVAGPSSISTTPQSLKGAGYGQADAEMAARSRPERGAAPSSQPPVRQSPRAMIVQQLPTAAQSQHGGGNQQRWAAGSDAARSAQNVPWQRQQQQQQQQYLAYQFPPPPRRPGPQPIQQPMMNPPPAQMTPTRRDGGDIYLSFQ